MSMQTEARLRQYWTMRLGARAAAAKKLIDQVAKAEDVGKLLESEAAKLWNISTATDYTCAFR